MLRFACCDSLPVDLRRWRSLRRQHVAVRRSMKTVPPRRAVPGGPDGDASGGPAAPHLRPHSAGEPSRPRRRQAGAAHQDFNSSTRDASAPGQLLNPASQQAAAQRNRMRLASRTAAAAALDSQQPPALPRIESDLAVLLPKFW